MNATATLFDAGELVRRPVREVAPVRVTTAEDEVTGLAGVAVWGPLLDRLNVVGEADRRVLRPIGPSGYSGGECYRAVVEVLLAGGDFLSDRSLLDGVTQQWATGGLAARLACKHQESVTVAVGWTLDDRSQLM